MAVDGIILTNNATGDVLELDKVTTEYYILQSVTWGEIEAQHHTFKYINQIGVQNTNTTLETRDVEIDGWIVATSESLMDERKRFLNRFLNPQSEYILRYKDYEIGVLFDRTIAYSENTTENNEVVCRFKMSGVCPNPLFSSVNAHGAVSASMQGFFRFPLALPNPADPPEYNMFGLRRSNYFVTVDNSGDLPTGIEITFEADTAVTNPRLVNVSTLEYFGLQMVLRAGESVNVNTSTGQKHVIGTYNGESSNYFKYRDFGSTWLQVQPGSTRFKLEADGNLEGLGVRVRQSDVFLEVQQCF